MTRNAIDTYLIKIVADIRKLDGDASLKLSAIGDEWMAVIDLPASFARVVTTGDKPSAAILKAWEEVMR